MCGLLLHISMILYFEFLLNNFEVAANKSNCFVVLCILVVNDN